MNLRGATGVGVKGVAGSAAIVVQQVRYSSMMSTSYSFAIVAPRSSGRQREVLGHQLLMGTIVWPFVNHSTPTPIPFLKWSLRGSLQHEAAFIGAPAFLHPSGRRAPKIRLRSFIATGEERPAPSARALLVTALARFRGRDGVCKLARRVLPSVGEHVYLLACWFVPLYWWWWKSGQSPGHFLRGY